MLLLQPVYGALVSRFPRRVFLPVVYLTFVACLGGFYWAFLAQMPGRGGLFFIWVAVFNLFAVSVFWSYMADIWRDAEARRLYGFIAAGGTIGGLLGPQITTLFVTRIGVGNMLLVSAGFLLLCLVCIVALGPAARRRELADPSVRAEAAMGGSVLEGLRRIGSDPLLRAMAVLMFFGVGVGTLLYNEQNAIVKAMTAGNPAGAEEATAFFSRIDRWINWIVLALQVFVTRFVLTRWGVAPLLMLPALAIFLGYALLAAMPLPVLVAAVQVLTRASEFALSKPARETIYTRVDREARYKAKAAIDTVVYRGGDLTFVWVHKGLVAFGSVVVFASGMIVAAAFAYGAWRVVREQAKLPGDRAL
jgi:AAA family ATP:ADP antiporter